MMMYCITGGTVCAVLVGAARIFACFHCPGWERGNRAQSVCTELQSSVHCNDSQGGVEGRRAGKREVQGKSRPEQTGEGEGDGGKRHSGHKVAAIPKRAS